MIDFFRIESVAVPLLWANYFTTDQNQYATISSATLLARIAGIGANDVRLIGSYGILSSVTDTSYDPFTVQSLASLKTFTDAAHALGIAITWSPITHFDGVIAGDPSQPSHLAPSDVAAWFANFRAVVLINAQLAEDIGAARFQFFSDIEQPVFENHPELADDMVALVAEIRTIFHGEVTCTISTADGLLVRFPRAILQVLDSIGLGLFPKLTTDNDASVSELRAGWHDEATFGRDIVTNLERLAVETGHNIWFSDFAGSSYDGANTLLPAKFDPNAIFVPDDTEQARYYEAAFQEMLAYGGTWFDGFSVQNISRIDDDNGLLPPYLQSAVGENFYGKPAEQILTGYFSGTVAPQQLVLHGSDYGETVRGGYAFNEIFAGRGTQSLIGGALADLFHSSAPASTSAHQLVLRLSGLPAAGIVPNFELRVNGVTVPVEYQVTTSLSPNGGSILTIPILVAGPITSIELVTTNWYISGDDNRLLRVHEIALDGQNLAALGIYHTHFNATEPFVGDTNRGGYVVYDTSVLTLTPPLTVALPANLTISGGGGVDTVVYQGNSSVFGLLFGPDGVPDVVKPNPLGGQSTDVLDGIEILQFDNKSLWVSPIMDATTDTVGRTFNLQAGALTTADFGRGAVTVENVYDLAVVKGGSGNDRIVGNGVGNALFGFGGDDILIGGDGSDFLDGGTGFDTADYSGSSAAVSVNLGTGLGNGGQAAGDSYGSIEKVLGSALGDTLTGANGADTLIGMDGDDILTGLGGDDTIFGGDGSNDEARYSGNRTDYLVENVTIGGTAYVQITGQGGATGDGIDLLRDVEFVQFADQRLHLINTRPVLGAPAIPDQNADDGAVFSYQIPESSFADPDSDPLAYSATLADGSALPAWFSFNSATRTFSGTPPFAAIGTVLQVKVTATDNFPGDPLSLVSDLFALTIVLAPGADVNGTGANDALSGTFRAERLFGQDGDDVLNGSDGADQMDGGNGSDTASYAGSGAGVAVDLGTGLGSSGQAAGDSYVGIEDVTGSALGDVLTGNAGANVLTGNGGIDTLNGAAGNDRLVVSTAGSGSNVNGGANVDTLAISGAVSLGTVAGLEAIELSGGAALTLTGAQVSTGFALTTAVTGTGSLTINMTAGLLLPTKLWSIAPGIAVTINGTSGTDIMKLGNVVQTVNGGDGTDQIKGGSQVDTINGGAGIDKIMGLGGADVLTGGTGNDVFRYLAQGDSRLGANADRITDFAIGQDRINFKDIDADAVTAGDQAFAFLGGGAFTSPGTGQIRYQDSGADLLVLVDVNGDGAADMSVILQGLAGQTLTGADFVL